MLSSGVCSMTSLPDSRPSQPVSDRIRVGRSQAGVVALSQWKYLAASNVEGSTKGGKDTVNTCRFLPEFSLSDAPIPESLCGLSVPAD